MGRKKKKTEEESAPIQYIENVIEEGVKQHENKVMYADMMKTIVSDTIAVVPTIERAQLNKMKDYIHYRGRGWGEDALDKGEDKEKFPDRVSPTFRHLVDIINTMYACGKQDLLAAYINAAKARGINIEIDEAKFEKPNEAEQIVINTALESLDPLQTKICECNDYMTDVLAPAAENQNVTPKSKYKKIVLYTFRNQRGKDIADNVEDDILENIMYGDSLERLRKEVTGQEPTGV